MPRPATTNSKFRVHFLLTKNPGELSEVTTREFYDAWCFDPEGAARTVRAVFSDPASGRFPGSRVVIGKIKRLAL